MPELLKHVTDQEGNQYSMWLDDDNDGFEIWLLDKNRCIGKAQCVLDSPEDMTWGNLIISDNAIFSPEGIWERVSLFLGTKRRRHSYRGRGLGKVLAREVLAHAQKKGVKRISGWVPKNDLDATPWLLTWYENLGFTIHRISEAAAGTDPVARLFLEFAEIPEITVET